MSRLPAYAGRLSPAPSTSSITVDDAVGDRGWARSGRYPGTYAATRRPRRRLRPDRLASGSATSQIDRVAHHHGRIGGVQDDDRLGPARAADRLQPARRRRRELVDVLARARAGGARRDGRHRLGVGTSATRSTAATIGIVACAPHVIRLTSPAPRARRLTGGTTLEDFLPAARLRGPGGSGHLRRTHLGGPRALFRGAPRPPCAVRQSAGERPRDGGGCGCLLVPRVAHGRHGSGTNR